MPRNFAIPENEPSAVKTNLNPEAVTPAIRMREEYDDRDWRINRWIYHRLTEKVDRQIGRILDGLGEAGLENNTLVIFTSDHGNVDASHRLTSKSLFYEESVGVPLIMRHPAGCAACRIDGEHLVSNGLETWKTTRKKWLTLSANPTSTRCWHTTGNSINYLLDFTAIPWNGGTLEWWNVGAQ